MRQIRGQRPSAIARNPNASNSTVSASHAISTAGRTASAIVVPTKKPTRRGYWLCAATYGANGQMMKKAVAAKNPIVRRNTATATTRAPCAGSTVPATTAKTLAPSRTN